MKITKIVKTIGIKLPGPGPDGKFQPIHVENMVEVELSGDETGEEWDNKQQALRELIINENEADARAQYENLSS